MRDYRGWPRHHGSRKPWCEGGGWSLDWLQHRAAIRAGLQRLPDPEPELQVLLRTEDDVREVRYRVYRLSWRVRDAGRIVRSTDPDSDREGEALSRYSHGQGVLDRPD